jgi:hypothetical protein
VPVYSIPVLLIKEILSPFYVFQLFSVCFWYADAYILYASAIVVSTVLRIRTGSGPFWSDPSLNI